MWKWLVFFHHTEFPFLTFMLAFTDFGVSRNNEKLTYTSTKLCGGLEDLYFEPNASSSDRSLLEIQIGANLKAKKTSFEGLTDRSKKSKENVGLYNQLKQLEVEKNELEKQKNSSCMARNLVYPLAMLLLLLLTSITVMLVIQNTIELLIGIKALPLSSRVSCYLFFFFLFN